MKMRIVDVEGIEEGMLAADDIKAFDGTIIVRKGMELEGRHMRLFKQAMVFEVRVLIPDEILRKDTIHIDDYQNNLATLKSSRIMIVDDSKFLRFKLEKALANAGLAVVGQATNGAEAVGMARELRPNVITMDIEMPVMDGISAIAPIREALPDVAIAMISSVGEEERILQALANGAMDFITKPIDPVATVRSIINMIIIVRGF